MLAELGGLPPPAFAGAGFSEACVSQRPRPSPGQALTPEHAQGRWAGDGPFFEAPRLAPAIRLRDDRRGARHWARIAHRKLVFGRFGPDHDAVMRIGGEA